MRRYITVELAAILQLMEMYSQAKKLCKIIENLLAHSKQSTESQHNKRSDKI